VISVRSERSTPPVRLPALHSESAEALRLSQAILLMKRRADASHRGICLDCKLILFAF